MGLKSSLRGLNTRGLEATKIMSKEFNNLEDQIIRVQKNQIEFEKYLLEIIDLLKKKKKK